MAPKLLTSLVGFLLFLLSASGANAAYFESRDFLTLPADKQFDETVFVSGQELIIDSEINGDLYCVGKSVVINGTIKGDIACAAQMIKINGHVEGDIRLAAMSTEINGIVDEDALSLSQSFVLSEQSRVKGDLFFGVKHFDLRGDVGRDLAGAGENISVAGSVVRNTKVAGSRITVLESASIGGDFEYFVDEGVVAMFDEKSIKGNIIKHEIINDEPSPPSSEKGGFLSLITGSIYWLISTLLLGLAMIYFVKSDVTSRIGYLTSKPLVSALVGFAFLILAPVAAIILFFTIVASPLAIILLLLYFLFILTANIYPTILLGRWSLKILKQKSSGLVWPLVTGVIVIGILSLVPPVGGLVAFLMLILGLGATFLSFLPQK